MSGYVSNSDFQLLKLHQFPQFINDCVKLLNSEWPRSEAARIHSLEKSCDALPMSLILINKQNQLIGHVKLKREIIKSRVGFIESLVVDKRFRSKGFGKYIMRRIEGIAKELGLDKLTLTTIDKMEFYQSLGFSITINANQSLGINNNNNICTTYDNAMTKCHDSTILPPQPPPLPPSTQTNLIESMKPIKTLMHKNI